MIHKKIVLLCVKASVLMLFFLLLLFISAHVCFAQESKIATDSNATEQGSPQEPEELPEEASPSDAEPERTAEEPEEPEEPADTVSTFWELTEWFSSHKKSGGTVRLENDIFLQAGERYIGKNIWPGDPTLYIDVGEYTIYVEGHLELYPELDFSGVGGENGIFHVEPGGYLQLNSITGESFYDAYVTVSAKEGYAIYQEEGAFFGRNTDEIIGEIRYADRPVVWPFSDVSEFYGIIEYLPVVVLPLKGEISEEDFPKIIRSYLCEDGRNDGWNGEQKYDLPVAWNFEEFEESFAARERFLLTGEYTDDVTAMVDPACLVTFQREDAAVFLQASAARKSEGKKLAFSMRIKLADPSMEYRLEWSADSEIWQGAKAEDIDTDEACADGEEYLFWWREDSDGIIGYEGGFYMEELPRYFSIAATDHQGHVTYSDTIFLDGEDKVAGWDNGGGRNGETNPGEPEDGGLPPITLPPVEPPLPPDEIIPPVEPPLPPDEIIPPVEPPLPPEEIIPPVEPPLPPEEIVPPVEPPLPPEYTDKGNTGGGHTPYYKRQAAGWQEPETGTPLKDLPRDVITQTEPVSLPGSAKPSQGGSAGLGWLSAERQQTFLEDPTELTVSSSNTGSDKKNSHTAAALAIIALIGAPVYLTPTLKKLWKSKKNKIK